MTSCILGVLLVATSLSSAEKNETIELYETTQSWNVTDTISTNAVSITTTTKAVTEATNLGPKLKDIGCRRPEDCSDVDGTYCDADLGFCLCKPDYPVTDTNHCYKESKYDEFCQLDIQCQRRDKNTKCTRTYNLCECQPQYVAQSFNNGQFWCVRPTGNQSQDSGIGSFFDPTLFIILGAMALMFIVMCVVLQLFAKAQFAENRSIFNTPNPRLMNVTLLKETKDGRHHRSTKKKKLSRNQSINDEESGELCGNSGSTNRKRSQPTLQVAKSHRGVSNAASVAAIAAATANNGTGNEDKIMVEMKDSRA